MALRVAFDRFFALFPALLVVASPAAMAGRPLDTDDAAVIQKGSCQLEAFARRVAAAGDAGAVNDTAVGTSCNPFGWGELLVGVERDGVGRPGRSTSAVLQVKSVPTPLTTEHAGWGFSAALAQSYVRGQDRPASRASIVNGIASIPVASGLQIDANLGWVHAWAPAPGNARDFVAWGAGLEWGVSGRTTLVAERTGTSRQGTRTAVGAALAVSPRVTLDVSAGRRNQPGDRAAYVAVGVTIVTASLDGHL